MDELCGYGRLYSAMVSTNSIITGTNMFILLYTTFKISKDTIDHESQPGRACGQAEGERPSPAVEHGATHRVTDHHAQGERRRRHSLNRGAKLLGRGILYVLRSAQVPKTERKRM